MDQFHYFKQGNKQSAQHLSWFIELYAAGPTTKRKLEARAEFIITPIGTDANVTTKIITIPINKFYDFIKRITRNGFKLES